MFFFLSSSIFKESLRNTISVECQTVGGRGEAVALVECLT